MILSERKKTLHSSIFVNFLTNITAVSQKDKNVVLVFFLADSERARKYTIARF